MYRCKTLDVWFQGLRGVFSTHLQEILWVLSLGQNLHTMDCIARREGTHSSPEVMASSLQAVERWILFHTHWGRAWPVLLDLLLQTSFPGIRLSTRPGHPSYFNCFSCGICELITLGSDCHICTNSCIYLAGLFLRLDLTASWLYSVWHVHAMCVRCCLSCFSCGCVKVGLIASCVQGIVVPSFSPGGKCRPGRELVRCLCFPTEWCSFTFCGLGGW